MPDGPIVIDDDGDGGGGNGDASREQQAPEVGKSVDAAPASECVICMEPYTEDSDHKPAVLKCGHHGGERCMRTWLRTNSVCPICRKRARLKDLVPVYNLPTVVAASGAATAPAAARSADPSELAQKELMLQKVQRKVDEVEKAARREAEARRHAEQKLRREEEARRDMERQVKRLKRELEEAQQRNIAAVLRAQTQAQGQTHQAVHGTAPHASQKHPHWHGGPAATRSTADGPAPPGHGPRSLPPPLSSHHSYHHPNQQHHHHQGSTGHLLQPNPHQYPQSGATAPTAAAPQWPPLGPGNGHGPAGAGSGPAPTMPGPSDLADGGGQSAQPHAAGNTMAPPSTTQMPPGPPSGYMWGNYSYPNPYVNHAGGGGGSQHTAQLDGSRRIVYGGASGSSISAAPHGQPGTGAFGAAAAFGGAAEMAGGGAPLFEPLFSVRAKNCRLLALDVARSRLLVSEGHSEAACCGVRKISMHVPTCSSIINLDANAGLLYDMQLPLQLPDSGGGAAAAGAGRLAAIVTRGMGLSLVCTQSESVVGTFAGLPQRPWSCSWVPYTEHLLLAGLEKGQLGLLDMRRMDGPVAVVAALPGDCACMPVRSVAALPQLAAPGAAAPAEGPEQEQADAQDQQQRQRQEAAGGAAWPACVVSCTKGAWLLPGAADGGGGGAPLALDRGGGAGAGAGPGGMQVESVAVQHWGWDGAGSEAGSGGCAAWRVAVSWKPAAVAGVGGGIPPVVMSGPQHDVVSLRRGEQAPYKHEATLAGYARRGIQSVRSCLIPPYFAATLAAHDQLGGGGGGGRGLLLASSDDDTRQPLLWALRGGGSGGGPHVVQRLESHPELPTCMVAARAASGGGGGFGAGDCFLACGSLSRVAVYRRRAG